MYVVVDNRPEVADAYTASFRGEGVASLAFRANDFSEWFRSISAEDINAVQSFILGEFEERVVAPPMIRHRTSAPIIALADTKSLEATLELFTAGIDDVVRKPVHVKEIMARSDAVWRRVNRLHGSVASQRLKVHFDGRDVEIDGEPLQLPRRERHILEFLVKNRHKRVTKTQIFNAIYGLFEDGVDEIVIEGHVSKLRKKLRLSLGCDVIDAKRYLGYQFVGCDQRASQESETNVDMELA